MPTIIKHTSIKRGFGPAIITGDIKSHENDPFVLKKVEKAVETLKKAGLPNLTKK